MTRTPASSPIALPAIARSWAGLLGIQARPAPGRMALAFVGAALGLAFTATVMRLWLGTASGLPLLIAPMGASAVLLFAVPASPLAQPWAIVGGNTLSALCGVLWLRLTGDPLLASGLAVGTAIVVMSLARCLHPPGGACALTAVIGGPAVVAAGWSFALLPVALDSALLVAIGWLFNAATRSNYPHRAPAYVAAPANATGFTMADIAQVLSHYDELLDVTPEDLDTLFRQVESRTYRRLHGIIACERIMLTTMPVLDPAMDLAGLRPLFAAHGLRALPVADATGHVEGLLTLDRLDASAQTVAEALDPSPCLAAPATPIDELLPILSGGRFHEALVVDARGTLLGMVTQTGLLGAVWRGHVAEHVAQSV